MELSEFISKHQIIISPATAESCKTALEKMSKSEDVLHDLGHIARIFDLLDEFLINETRVRKDQINFEVLLLAISWHDTWKATRRDKRFWNLLFSLYYDGIGSAKIFKKQNKILPIDIFEQALFAIARHSPPRLVWYKTLELKILRDLDGLEEWSIERLDGLVSQFENNRTAIHRLGRWLKLYFNLVLKKQKAKKYYFPWPREVFSERKKVYIVKVNELLKKYQAIL